MQPALSTPFAQPPIPAWGELSEKPRLGFTSKNPALYLGQSVCNSTAAIGMRAGLALNCVRSRYRGEQYDPDLGLYYLRARYYNPATGRFLSRDPEDGNANLIRGRCISTSMRMATRSMLSIRMAGRRQLKRSLPRR
jgi:RHS repeat-associated protein